MRVLANEIPSAHGHHIAQSFIFGLIVFGAFIVFIGLNLVLNELEAASRKADRSLRQVREFLPCSPAELAAGALATILVVTYTSVGPPALFAAIVLLLIFRHLMVALLRSEDRAEQLEARSRQLVGLAAGGAQNAREGARHARQNERPPRRRGRPLREGSGESSSAADEAGAGSSPFRRAAP